MKEFDELFEDDFVTDLGAATEKTHGNLGGQGDGVGRQIGTGLSEE